MADAVTETFNPLDPAYRNDPYAVYRRLLDGGRVHEGLLGTKVLVRHADCLAALHHPNASSDDTKSTLYQQAVASGAISEDPELLLQRPFLFMDPPDHTRLRGLVSKAFTPRRIEALRPRISEIVGELLDAVGDGGELDVVEDFAYPLPVQVICEMMGVPVADHETFKEWSRALARSLDPEMALPPDQIEARNRALNDFHEYFKRLIAERRATPGPDLLSALIEAEEAGDRLSEDELLSTLVLLLVAGHETTVNLIANGVLALLRNPEEQQRLRDDPDLIRSAVEEILRWDPPVQLDGRTFVDDVDLDGIPISAGEQVLLLLAAANRDGSVFPDPDRFDITRGDNHHISFGHGIHHCLGAALARAEGQAALGELVRRFKVWEPVFDEPVYKENIVLRGLAALPVRVKAA